MGATKGKAQAGTQLRTFIERIERVSSDIEDLGDDRKAIYAEAKASGFDTKTIRRIVKLRKLDKLERDEQQALLDTYLSAIGMAEPLPLFAFAGQAGFDPMVRESMVDALGELVPENAAIIVQPKGGGAVRLFRDHEGKVQAEDWTPEVVKVDPAIATSKADGIGFDVDTGKAPEAQEKQLDEAKRKGLKAGRAQSSERNPYRVGDPCREAWSKAYHEGLQSASKAPAEGA